MSRVFLATELELDRQVVVKLLPPELSAGINTDRFRREIQLAARLQHPHIVPLLTAGAKGSLLYYTMPYIAGENLRARLTRDRELPVQEATRIMREIADALDYAHSQGVVHRDIKPENILLSGNHALVTDFGVSKALSSATSESAAISQTLTSLGMALGTPAYMAPEQAAADPHVDHRADIYAVGILGYELLAGFTPFSGQNQQQTLAAHITATPPLITGFRPQIPPGLASAIMRCLEKRPSDRWQSARELHDALEPFAMTSGTTAATAAAPGSFRWTPQRIAVAAGLLGLITTAFVASTLAFRGEKSGLVIGNTQQITSAPGLEIHPSISPDGRMIAYVTGTSGRSRLFVRQLSGGRAIPLTDSSSIAQWPRWSPDGAEIIYSSAGQKWIVPSLGGAPTPVPALDSLHHCTWSNSGNSFACARSRDAAIVVVERQGGNTRVLTSGGEPHALNAPSWSPDDKLIAFTKGNEGFLGGADIGNIAPSSIWVIRAEGGRPVKVSDEIHLNMAPVWTHDGALLFVSSLGGSRDIYMQELAGDLAPRGKPTRLTTGLNPHTISLSRDDRTLAYSVFTTVANIWTATIDGSAEANTAGAKSVTSGNQTIEQGFVSPDGKWLAYDSNLNGNQDIYKVLLAGGEPQQLTRNDVDNFYPTWSPNGKEIAFHSLKNGNRDIYVMEASGANVRAAVEIPGEQFAPTWRDAHTLLYVSQGNIFEVRKAGAIWGKPKFLVRAGGAAYSPDGNWLFRIVNDAGIICKDCPPGPYLFRSDGSDAQRIEIPRIQQILENGGGVTWSRDSRHLYASMAERDGSTSIWQLPINGDEEKRVLHFTDPARQTYRSMFDVYGSNIYFTIGDRQSDIWVMELKKP